MNHPKTPRTEPQSATCFRKIVPEVTLMKFRAFLCGIVVGVGVVSSLSADPTGNVLSRELFIEPPIEARPGAYWAWLNGNVDLPQITHELEEMKDKGMSGAEIWDVLCLNNKLGAVPAGPAFLGPESVKAISFAIDEANRLGLRLGLVASSSWNAGGSWVTPDWGLKRLVFTETTVKGPAAVAQVLPQAVAAYYKDTAVLAFPSTTNKTIDSTTSVVNLTDRMDAKGLLKWNAPAGEWVILRLGCGSTGEKLMIPSPNSVGLVIDHMDPEAIQRHFEYIIRKILEVRKGLGALKYMEVDSIEVSQNSDWTDGFMREFRSRRGYDPTPYLPLLKGWKLAETDLAERFRRDFLLTRSDLWIDYHYRKGADLLNRHGLQLVGEPGHGGSPMVEPLKALGAVDVPRGEFWNKRPFWVIKEAASAGHIYGRRVIDAESFTSFRHWQEGPAEYKQLADIAFCAGMNRLTYHNFAHNPPQAGLPGWVYHAGEHINVNTTWWPVSKPFHYYLGRCCYLLQQGLPVADACYYYGDDAPNLVAPPRVDPALGKVDPNFCKHCGFGGRGAAAPLTGRNPAPTDALGAGYDYDVVNTDVILNRMKVKDGRIVLPDGMSYGVLVLPERQDMPLAVLQKLDKLVSDGATVLGPKPTRTNTLSGYPQCDLQVKDLADKLWGECDGKTVHERRHGRGRIVWDRNRVRQVLADLGIGSDCTISAKTGTEGLDYVHRRTEKEDIYFISNSSNDWVDVECVFRVSGKRPELWMPETGAVARYPVYDSVAAGTKVPFRLPPCGSVFVVFRDPADAEHLVAMPEIAGGAPYIAEFRSPVVEMIAGRQGNLELLAWRGGACVLRGSGGMRREVRVETVPAPRELTGPWEVRFAKDRGAPESKVFEDLHSWTNDPEDGVKYFSGAAAYHQQFDLPADWLKGGDRVFLELGRVRNVAEVTLNGRRLGICWTSPWRLEATGILRPGANTLVVEVANLWANRMIGDGKLPPEKRICRSSLPPMNGQLLESGLLGPVRLLNARQIIGGLNK